jgi:chromosome partitioning protein
LNALVAADSILVPLQCEFFALEGISHMLRTIEMVQVKLNPGLRLQGIVLTMFDKRNNLSEMVAADARSFFGVKVYDTVIPRNIRLSEAPSHGKSALSYDPRSAGSMAYVKLASEFRTREHLRGATL